MPLPPALLARLEKRGILNATAEQKRDKSEEVIAEDDGDRKRRALLAVKVTDIADKAPVMQGIPGCPNKYNIYHECGTFCSIYWGNGILEPDKIYMRKKKKMLNKYPLPDHWKEEYDPGTGRFFYWDQQTNMVSWLPPLHPKAQVTEAAAVLREKARPASISKPVEEPSISMENEESDDDDDDDSDDSDTSNSDGEGQPMQLSELQSRLSRERNRQMSQMMERKAKRGNMRKDNDLDPMDPASYSDIPRGTWSTGLGQEDDAKTGVDTTATGPLFQQRPYPSPGAILRANAGKK